MWRLKGGVRTGKEFDTRLVLELVSFSREELELSHEASRAFSGDSLFDLTIGQCRRLPISSIRSSKKLKSNNAMFRE